MQPISANLKLKPVKASMVRRDTTPDPAFKTKGFLNTLESGHSP